MDTGQIRAKLGGAGYLVRSNLWRGVADAGMGKEGAYIVIDLMKVSDWTAWEDTERTVFKPMQELRIKDGDTQAWGAARLAMPRGTGLEYNAVTFNVFPDMQSTGKAPKYEARFAKAHAGKSFEDAIEKTLAAREIVQSGMFQMLVMVTAK